MVIAETERLTKRAGLPDALRVLVAEYPRATWEGHANFGELVRFWMDRHLTFRKLTAVLREDAQALIDGISAETLEAYQQFAASLTAQDLHQQFSQLINVAIENR